MNYRDFVDADPRVTRLPDSTQCEEIRSRGGRCRTSTTYHFNGIVSPGSYFPEAVHRSRDVCWSHLVWYLHADYRQARTAT